MHVPESESRLSKQVPCRYLMKLMKRMDADLMLLHRVSTPFHHMRQVRLQPASSPTHIGKTHAQTLSEPNPIEHQTDLLLAFKHHPLAICRSNLDIQDFDFPKATLSNHTSATTTNHRHHATQRALSHLRRAGEALMSDVLGNQVLLTGMS